MRLDGLRTGQFRPADINAARDWYAGYLGIEPYFDEPFYVGFEIAGYELGLFSDESGRDEPLFLWASDDPEADIARAVSFGATPGMPPIDTGDGTIVGSFIDPFGNEFGLIRNPHFAPRIVAAAADDVSDRVINIKVEVPTTPDEAYRLWATGEGLSEWWTEHNDIDLRPGGKYEIHFRPDETPGNRGGDWCRVLSFLPGKMLSFTWNSPPELKTRPLHTWVVVLFNGTPNGCLVDFNHYGWPRSGMADPGSDWPATFEYFEDAWSYVTGLFVAHFEDM